MDDYAFFTGIGHQMARTMLDAHSAPAGRLDLFTAFVDEMVNRAKNPKDRNPFLTQAYEAVVGEAVAFLSRQARDHREDFKPGEGDFLYKKALEWREKLPHLDVWKKQ